MFNLSSKIAFCGVFTIVLLGVGQRVSFSNGGGTVADNASTLSIATDPSAITGYADGSAKAVESSDDLSGQYSSTPCTTCRKRYYTQGPYYMNYPAYVECINEPCS